MTNCHCKRENPITNKTILMKNIDEENINPSEKYAQILIEMGTRIDTIKGAIRIVEDLGIHVIATKNISPQLILLELDTKDMREAATKLAENGFSIVKAYNAPV